MIPLAATYGSMKAVSVRLCSNKALFIKLGGLERRDQLMKGLEGWAKGFNSGRKAKGTDILGLGWVVERVLLY